VGNLDGRPGLEIVVGSDSSYVHAWHANGTPVAGWPVRIEGQLRGVHSAPVIGDVDGDGGMEVAAGANDYRLYAWHADGTRVPGFPVRTGYNVVSGPALADLDEDDDPSTSSGQAIELAVGSYDYAVYVFDLPGPARPAALEWPMYRHDPARTGHYPPRGPWRRWLPLILKMK
jgi:hypothetical protein